MSSCSLFNKKETVQKQEAILPQDRQALLQKEKEKFYSPEDLAKGIIKGDWAIEEVMGKKAVGEKAPYLKFSTTDSRIYGNNGCNTINADFKYNVKDSTLVFENVLTTMILCHTEGITDQDINNAINNTRYYSLKDDGDYYIMRLFDKDHHEVMMLMHQNFEFLNGMWKVVAIDEDPVDVPGMRLVIDVDEQKLHGNTGCNVINGKFDTDMDTPNSISFSNIAVTMMLCNNMEYQTALLIALEDANKAKPISATKVLLLNSDDKVVLTLEKTTE